MVSEAEGEPGPARIAVTTVASASDAKRLADLLVTQRLAACVTILPPVLSTFRWQGTVATEEEHLLWIKTTEARLPTMAETLREHHPYEVPELLVLAADCLLPAYLAWLVAETTSSDEGA